ncbi:MAG TPA: S41 family peptidase, partial [Pirellulaceae bacterium]
LYHLETGAAKQMTDFEGTDSQPMWQGEVVYYLSDAGAEHRLNIWSYDTQSGERSQVTDFKEDDCKWPAIGPGPEGQGEIVFQNGSRLYLVDLATRARRVVEVTIPGDRPRLRPHRVDASKFLNSSDISAKGKRLALEARGDIWTVPAKEGAPRNLTRTSGVAERFPAWSPDGQWIAYFSDASGEYELHVTQSDGLGTTKTLTRDGDCYRFAPNWSPDSKYITFTDKTGSLWLYSFDKDQTAKIDVDPYAESPNASWSHNSQWLVYARNTDEKAPRKSLWVYQVQDGTKKQLTSGYFADSNPVFDRKGDFVFFTSSRSFRAPKYEDLGTSFIYDATEVLMALPLREDVKLPFQPKSDEEKWNDKPAPSEEEKSNQDQEESDTAEDKDSSGDDDKEAEDDDKADAEAKERKESKKGDDEPGDAANNHGNKKDKDKEESAPKVFTIDFDGTERRAIMLPVPAGSFGGLAVNHRGHLIFTQQSPSASDGQEGPRGDKSAIKLLNLKDAEQKPKTVVEGASQFGISANGRKLVVYRGPSKAFVVNAAPDQKLEKQVPMSGLLVNIDPRAEWRQMFHEAWRLERDFFYDPKMHGVDWPAVRDHYARMLDDCVSRRDVAFVISEMISELNVGHAYYFGGDVESGPQGNVGLLGCRFAVDQSAYKIVELYEGADWDVDARNPLRAAGVKVGEYLLAVNGVALTSDENPLALLQGLAGMTVTLTISADPQRDATDRQVVVKTLGSDSELRFRGWIERNRQYVARKTDGKVGYIYVVNTGVPGQNDLVRQYFAQLSREALIIDDRWNGGGQIPTRFIELLNRPVTNYWAVRDGRDWTWPPDAHHGPKCMLINGMAGSGGDMFPALFKQARLGQLIGTRTWGGLVGISGNPGLIDGAGVTAPTFAYYELDGTWGIEGHGVDPDLHVMDDPGKMSDGADPQLDAAIELMQKELATRRHTPPPRPAYPDRSAFGIKPSDK